VRFILDAVVAVAESRPVLVYLVDGRLVAPAVAAQQPQLAAASNWHALARFAGRFAPQGPALVIDAGSTTCDVIPLVDGRPAARGATDTQRLLAGELVYSGVERTPIGGVTHELPYRERRCPVASELFATARDAYVVLGQLPEDPQNTDTADGRPLTKAACQLRLGRMLCADASEFDERDALAAARWVAEKQAVQLAIAIAAVRDQLPGPPARILVAGHGDFLVNAALKEAGVQAPAMSLSRELGSQIARCAPAHALAVLAREASDP
jgi:probable H4MPT-linked C1 transfer pathway protein